MIQRVALRPGEVIEIITSGVRLFIHCEVEGSLLCDNENVQEPDTMLLTESGWLIDEVLPKNEVNHLIREKRTL